MPRTKTKDIQPGAIPAFSEPAKPAAKIKTIKRDDVEAPGKIKLVRDPLKHAISVHYVNTDEEVEHYRQFGWQVAK